jgi:peptide/nickel transport system substrate-binding protein/nickel transport system substrate-binding protein
MKNKLKKLITLSLGLILVTSLLFACGNKDVQTNSGQTNNTEKNEKLTIAVSKEVNNLYTLNMNTENYVVAPLVYETLVSYDNGEIKPKLAEKWEWNEDNTKLTFHLKKGVTFHDGEVFDAKAVKTNLEFYHSDSNFSAVKAFANLNKVEVVDDYTVAVHYPAPCFSYINDYCFQNVAGIASTKAFEEGNFQTMKEVAGTGPYVYDKFVSGDSATFKRNDKYWGEKPYYAEVVAKYIPEASSRIQSLKTGEIDLIYGSHLFTYDDYKQATTINGLKGQINKGDTLTRNLVLNASSEMLNDMKVREAIAYSINKKEITEGLTYGFETPADRLFIDGVPYTDVTLKKARDYDIDKAKALLDEAGWKLNESTGIREKNGKQLKLNYTYWQDVSLNKEIAIAIKTQLAKAGIDVETNGKDQMTWWTDGVAGKYDITMWNTEVAYTAPHKFFLEMLGTDPHLVSLKALKDFSEFESKVKDFSTTADISKVKGDFDYLLNYTNENVIDCPISYTKDLVVYNSKKISGYTFTSTPIFFDITKIEPVKSS